MVIYAIVIAAALAAPADSGKADQQTYVLELKNGTSLVGFIESQKNDEVLRLRPDEPWNPKAATRVIKRSDLRTATPKEERATTRRERIERGWTEAGYTKVGENYVRTEEYKLAQFTRDLATKRLAVPEEAPVSKPSERVAPAGDQTPLSEPAAAAPPSRWGLHVLVLGIGLGLAAVIMRTMVLRGD